MKEKDKDSTELDVTGCKYGNGQVVIIWAWIVAVFCVGGIMGGSIVGVVSSRVGRYALDHFVKAFNVDLALES